jgi:hypothetical protein
LEKINEYKTNLFPSRKCGKDVRRNVYINEARRERD